MTGTRPRPGTDPRAVPGATRRPGLVAVPVYGSRVLPRFGLARTFHLAARDGADVREVGRRVWDPTREPRLARWLRDQGVEGVLCGGIHPRFQVALELEGLWVLWGQRGEVDTVLARWARGETRPPAAEPCQRRGRTPAPGNRGEHCDCPPWRNGR